MGLIPGLESPTANPVVPLGCALVTWFYYQAQGILKNGPIGYLKHFIGPQDPNIPLIVRLILPVLMFPIEIFSHLARLLVVDSPSLRQHVRGRNGDAGIFLAGSSRRPGNF